MEKLNFTFHVFKNFLNKISFVYKVDSTIFTSAVAIFVV